MSLRCVVVRAWQNGRLLVQRLGPPKILPRQGIATEARSLGRGGSSEAPRLSRTSESRNLSPSHPIRASYEGARKIFLDNVLRRVTNSMSAELRKKTTAQLFYGNSRPFFALVGVSLASGTGLINKQNELDGICWEIREAVAKMQRSESNAESDFIEEGEPVSLSSFVIGPHLAKGSNAVVYAARKTIDEHDNTRSDQISLCLDEPLYKFPFALKMMFNYDAESNALSILRAMHRETVPARLHYTTSELEPWEQSFMDQTVALPPHPNIVAMHCVFADHVPRIPGSMSMYPDALPARLNPDGSGRNMSLFLLMKRYDMSLRDYLSQGKPETREAILLFTQLLEAVCHMNRHGVAHRDLKSDNVLLEMNEGLPTLVVTDFGCCLANKHHGLVMPYRTLDTDKGGNAALMAPEVIEAEPGLFSYIDYSKSDCWAAGTLGYELFTGQNPFYKTTTNPGALQSRTYREEELPTLPEEVPMIFNRLLLALLSRAPSKRPRADVAATICQLFLWAPSNWLNTSRPKLPSSSEILQWLLCLTTKVLCSSPSNEVLVQQGRRATAEYQLISSFLIRVRISTIRSALNWIHSA